MAQPLEARVEELDKKLRELTEKVEGKPASAAWLGSVGTLRDDAISREADRLGREHRRESGDSFGDAGA